MGRPKIPRKVGCKPRCTCFRPELKSSKKIEELLLLPDEAEVLKLHDIEGMEQKVAAHKMGISQPTFGRILKLAHEKISDALINGKIIRFCTC